MNPKKDELFFHKVSTIAGALLGLLAGLVVVYFAEKAPADVQTIVEEN